MKAGSTLNRLNLSLAGRPMGDWLDFEMWLIDVANFVFTFT